MSSLLGLVGKFPRPALRTIRPRAFLSSTATLLQYKFKTSQKRVQDFLKERGFPDINLTAKKFNKSDLESLRVIFQAAPSKDHVIPNIEVEDPKEFILPTINRNILTEKTFDIHKLDISNESKSLIYYLHNIIVNETTDIEEPVQSITIDMVIMLLLHIFSSKWPLIIRCWPKCGMFLFGQQYLVSRPEFIIDKDKRLEMVIIEDRHIENIGPDTNFGETQLAAELLTCGYENMNAASKFTDQYIFAVRFLFTDVTFYKASIPAAYWEEICNGLPTENSVLVERWPGEIGLAAGLDLTEPDGRQQALEGLTKIAQYLLQKTEN